MITNSAQSIKKGCQTCQNESTNKALLCLALITQTAILCPLTKGYAHREYT